jgi:hypothetical protein
LFVVRQSSDEKAEGQGSCKGKQNSVHNGEDNMSRLTGKTALVTGASRGIAKNLGAEGAAVVVNYATSREGAASSTFTAAQSVQNRWVASRGID